MISKEEMYEFASLIAGITDADLEAYKCGGKTKMKKKASGGNVIDDIKNTFTPLKKQISKKLAEKSSRKHIETYPGITKDALKKAEQLRQEKEQYPERFTEDGSRKYNKSLDKPTNENVKPTRLRRK